MAAVRDSDLFDRTPLAADEAPPPVEAAAPVIDSDGSDYTSDEEAASVPPTSAQRQHAIPSRQQRIHNAADTASIAHGASADASQNQSAAAAQCCATGIQALARGSLHEAVRCFTAATHHDVHCRAAFADRCILNALAGFYTAALPDAVWLLRGSLVGDSDFDSLSNPQILFKQVQTRARELVLPCIEYQRAGMALAGHEVEARMFEAVTMLDQGMISSACEMLYVVSFMRIFASGFDC